jgi:hypothetical protein
MFIMVPEPFPRDNGQREVSLSSIEAFIAELSQRGLRNAVLAWRAEYGQHPVADAVRYERLLLLTLLAYDSADGCIVRADLEGVDRAVVKTALLSAGLIVQERSRNIV